MMITEKVLPLSDLSGLINDEILDPLIVRLHDLVSLQWSHWSYLTIFLHSMSSQLWWWYQTDRPDWVIPRKYWQNMESSFPCFQSLCVYKTFPNPLTNAKSVYGSICAAWFSQSIFCSPPTYGNLLMNCGNVQQVGEDVDESGAGGDKLDTF